MNKLILLALAICAVPAFALTTVQDTIYKADGTTCSGSIDLQWQTFYAPDGHLVSAGSASFVVASNGTFSLSVEPGYYAANYLLNALGCAPSAENWIVPNGGGPYTLAQVRTLNAPTTFTLIPWTWMGQNGATTGESPVWSGVAWVPGTPAGSGGGWTVTGGTTSTSLNASVGGNLDVSGSATIGTTLPLAPGSPCVVPGVWGSNAKAITPQMCGAKADGVTDDSAAFYAACLAAAPMGGSVSLLGTYSVNLNFNSSAYIGCRLSGGNNRLAGLVPHSHTVPVIQIDTDGIELDHFLVSGSSLDGDGIVIHGGATHLLITRSTVTGFTHSGSYAIRCGNIASSDFCVNVTLDNVVMQGDSGLYIYGSAVHLKSPTFESSVTQGFYVASGFGISIDGILCETNGTYCGYINDAAGMNITGGYFEAHSAAHLYINSSAYAVGVTITGAYFNADGPMPQQIYLNGCQGCSISGNTFNGPPTTSHLLINGGGYTSGLSIYANAVTQGTTGPFTSFVGSTKLTNGYIEDPIALTKVLAGNLNLPVVTQVTGDTPSLQLTDTHNQASVRNWAWATNNAAYGDSCLKQSATKGGDPLSGTCQLTINSTGASVNAGGAASTGVCWMADSKGMGHCTSAWSGTQPTCTCSQ